MRSEKRKKVTAGEIQSLEEDDVPLQDDLPLEVMSEILHRLPFDVIIDILVWLPVKSLLRFKCVCKEWFNLINNPLFISLHLEKSHHVAKPSLAFINRTHNQTQRLYVLDDLDSPNSNPIQSNWLPNKSSSNFVVDSCNGLLCVICKDSQLSPFFYVCNPSTGSFKEVYPTKYMFWIHCGFGYDFESDDYKIVVVTNVDEELFVYSLKEDLWRNHRTPTKDIVGLLSNCWPARFLNNRLHWAVILQAGLLGTWCEVFRIGRFNLSSEEWDESLHLPPTSPEYAAISVPFPAIGTLEGRLCLSIMLRHPKRVDIWTMNEYGVQESWTKLLSASYDTFNHISCYCPVSYSKDGTKILVSGLCGDGLYWYDLEKATVTQLNKIGKQVQLDDSKNFVLHSQSLVSIPNGTTSAPVSQV